MVAKVKAKKTAVRKKNVKKVARSQVEKTVAKTLKNKAFSKPVQRAGRTSTTRLSSKNQITIPVEILRKAGFKVGDTMNCTVDEEGKIELARPENRILSLLGAGNGIFDDFDLEAERADAWPE